MDILFKLEKHYGSSETFWAKDVGLFDKIMVYRFQPCIICRIKRDHLQIHAIYKHYKCSIDPCFNKYYICQYCAEKIAQNQ